MGKPMFFLGKGGVGKSTLSAAAAYQMSASRTILHVSLDPAHNLGDIYNTKLSDKTTRVRDNLDVIEVNIHDWIARYLKWSENEIRVQYLYNITVNLDSFFDVLKYSPGTEEYAVLWAIENIYKENQPKYDIIVFDTPPTALSLRFFAMPTISMRWIDGLTSIRDKILTKRETLLRMNPESNAIRGATKKEEDKVSTRLSLLNSRLAFMYDIFTQKSFIVVVVNNDRLSITESVRIGDELKKLSVPVQSICLNKAPATDGMRLTSELEDLFPRAPLFRCPEVPSGINCTEDLMRVNISDFLDHYLSGKG